MSPQCRHESVLAYDLSEEEKTLVLYRLNQTLQQGSGSSEKNFNADLNMKFLTPHGRCERAKSLLTSRATHNDPTTASKQGDYSPEMLLSSVADENSATNKKYRSSTKGQAPHSRISAPSQFFNCADCGSFYVNVSAESNVYPLKTILQRKDLPLSFDNATSSFGSTWPRSSGRISNQNNLEAFADALCALCSG